MRELDEYEDGLIERFRRHPALRGVTELSPEDLHAVLLQRRFLSLAFTMAYDLAIDLLTDEQSKRIARVIIREEYPDNTSPGSTPSHREDLMADILALGVPREALVRSRRSLATTACVDTTMELIASAGDSKYADVELLTILRFWGEVLVSVEYGELWRRIGPVLGGKSVFYYPHHVHDAKSRPLAAASPLSLTHSDQLGLRLVQLIDSSEARERFRETEQAVVAVKTAFYDQFLPAS
ncbi:hypothetical protein ACFORH_15480 [Amycolatopsis roodepoortensis]|uniref:Uncharacterized protein n=1 Tax=Amycolatopsis roodepoortensis TaxID=700274 RepID=A0ABR9KZF2_9PSEU|nr:hypothetical protein [Amycolatopsis roodepoortensis]MBE1573756.1 hypothetical protein [Amycolatopsis roodepoortensis]